jgi:DNA-binding NtrC family response regulator
MAENYPGTINLLITDLEMPGMDGVRLAEILNKSRPDMKIIYMSGSLEHLHRCEETFVEGSLRLEKPVRIDKLEAIMAKLLV